MNKINKRDTGGIAKSMASHFNSIKNTIIYSIVLVILSSLPIAAVVIGSMKFHDCTIQPLIPI